MNEQKIGTLAEAVNYEGGEGTTDYNDLLNKPQIEGVTLQGNKTAAQLGLASADDLDAKADKDNAVLTGTTNAENVVVSGDLTSDSDASFNNVVVSGEIDVPTPTADNQAATKKYVDDNATSDYSTLSNKPKINGVELTGDKTDKQLNLANLDSNTFTSTQRVNASMYAGLRLQDGDDVNIYTNFGKTGFIYSDGTSSKTVDYASLATMDQINAAIDAINTALSTSIPHIGAA